MHLRGGGIFYYRFTTNLLLSLSVKEFRISVSIYQNYCKEIYWLLIIIDTVLLTTSWRQFKPACHQTWSVIPLATGYKMIKIWKVSGGRYVFY